MIRIKKIVFLTGTRADYGKIKSLLRAIDVTDFELHVYICGMHLLEKYGSTYLEVQKDGYGIQTLGPVYDEKELISSHGARLLEDFGKYIDRIQPDLLVVHGDRMEALLAATCGVLHNVSLAHIEGGEVSGTMDESLRHAISKLCQYHFVSNEVAKKRLLQMGEVESHIFVIGSPDIDMMFTSLPSLDEVKKHYDINFEKFSLVIYHPITTMLESTTARAEELAKALIESGKNFVVIYPNNDSGSKDILDVYQRFFIGVNTIKMFPSIRFEAFLTLLKSAECIIGNSSAGVREAAVYGVPAIDIGLRQLNRYDNSLINITHVEERKECILQALPSEFMRFEPILKYGKGNSTDLFMRVINNQTFWDSLILQKVFVDR